MRCLLTTFFLLIFTTTFCQDETVKFYDYKWTACEERDARFLSVTKKKGEVWLKNDLYILEKNFQMIGTYANEECTIKEGAFKFFHPNGKVSSFGNYVANKKDGLWLSYYANGMMEDSTHYANGQVQGVALSWYEDGTMKDSSTYYADGKNTIVGWHDNGALSFAGRRDTTNKPIGHWQFFHANGKLSGDVVYENYEPVKALYFNEDETALIDTSNIHQEAYFGDEKKTWNKYVMKNIYFPHSYTIGSVGKAIVVVEFTIDRLGNVINPKVIVPLHPDFDKVVMDLVKFSPKWHPGKLHNRHVTTRYTQAVSFTGEPTHYYNVYRFSF